MKRALSASAVAAFFFGVATPAFAGDAVLGAKLYRQMCTHCHGAKMVNPGNVSFDLRKLTDADEERFRTSLVDGKGSMPPLGKRLKPEEIDDLWAYVLTGGKG